MFDFKKVLLMWQLTEGKIAQNFKSFFSFEKTVKLNFGQVGR